MPNRDRAIPAAAVALAAVALAVAAGCSGSVAANGPGARRPVAAPPSAGTGPVVLAAGDVARCGSSGSAATAAALARPGTVAVLGDAAYESGSPDEFRACYGPTWGAFKARTRPTPGNHEYATPGAAGYFGYFGAAAGPADRGFYSYDLGGWHVVVLNSNCAQVGGCDEESPQGRWLRADLRAHPALCTLAYWHEPRFTSGTEHGNNIAMAPVWRSLYDAGADIVLNGHEHNYERFAPQTPDGTPDARRGIREFVVGTGGGGLYADFGAPLANSRVRNDDTFGVLRLDLLRGSYRWQFVPVGGGSFTDAGTGRCHS